MRRRSTLELRPFLYLVAGALVGFLWLGEFALDSLVPVQLGFVVLALAALVGAIRGVPALGLWAIFVAAAEVVPIMIDAPTVALAATGLLVARDVSRLRS